METYFDPVPLLGDARMSFRGEWADRKWMNVPGPFYGADTDNCGTGRIHAPELVLYEVRYFAEYVYRQPRTTEELWQRVGAAEDDPMMGYGYGYGYGCDGDVHWTPTAVREWWRDRGRIREYLAIQRRRFEADDVKSGQRTPAAARDYAAYLAGDLVPHLRAYLFWLEDGAHRRRQRCSRSCRGCY
ncbi:ferredoxin [Streptomyces sp. NPDC048383]|uniref:ferredoxin n=1 Tax=Streptomyces sp. NPDC048383 TaxID=3155386 RepID=UPI00342CEDC7